MQHNPDGSNPQMPQGTPSGASIPGAGPRPQFSQPRPFSRPQQPQQQQYNRQYGPQPGHPQQGPQPQPQYGPQPGQPQQGPQQQPQYGPQPGQPQQGPQPRQYPPRQRRKKSHTGLIITLAIIGAVLLTGGIAAIILANMSDYKTEMAPMEADASYLDDSSDEVSDFQTDAEAEAQRLQEEAEAQVAAMQAEAEAAVSSSSNPSGYYNISTVTSGYPIVIKLNVSPDGSVSGKYAYESTLRKYGDKPKSWFTISGTVGDDGVISMDITHPDYGLFEFWVAKIYGSGSNATITGTMTNVNTGSTYYLGSNAKPTEN